jgi:hypothetical protein
VFYDTKGEMIWLTLKAERTLPVLEARTEAVPQWIRICRGERVKTAARRAVQKGERPVDLSPAEMTSSFASLS